VINCTEAQQTRALIAIESGTTTKNYPRYFNVCAPGIRVASHADLPSAQQGWIDFVIRSQPGPDGEGHIEVIAGGVHTVTLQGHIGHGGPGLDDNQYFKMGPYRAPPPCPGASATTISGADPVAAMSSASGNARRKRRKRLASRRFRRLVT
jgi:hypothetical protein